MRNYASQCVTVRLTSRHTPFILRLLRPDFGAVSLGYVMLTKPKAWRSPLHAHLAEIRRMRRSRRTWQEITDYLTTQHGLRLTRSGLCHFFRRATRRPLPMGFEDPIATVPRQHSAFGSDSHITQEEQHKQKPEHQEISVMPINKPKQHPIFGSWTPEQGINYTPKDF